MRDKYPSNVEREFDSVIVTNTIENPENPSPMSEPATSRYPAAASPAAA